MKILLISDLHDDKYGLLRHPNDVNFLFRMGSAKHLGHQDVILVAGDVGDGPLMMNKQLKSISSLSKAQVIAVMGNHDYYGSALGMPSIDVANLGLPSRARVVENETIVVDGVRFVCATLWTSAGDGKFAKYDSRINDYKAIYKDESRALITAMDTMRVHQGSLAFIENELAKPFQGMTVVMTHHAPSFRSISIEFTGSTINAFFATDLEWMINKYQPHLWVHGHLHEKMDYQIGGTRVLCQPRGYPSEQRQIEYDPFLIEIA